MRRVVLILAVAVASAAAAGAKDSDHGGGGSYSASLSLRLLQRAATTSRIEYFRTLSRRDAARAAAINKRPPSSSSVAMPLFSGAYTGTGQYFVQLKVGTPAKAFLLIADTGSDLTWIKCDGAAAAGSRVFQPAKSRSWRPIRCSSATCKSSVPFTLQQCAAAGSPCVYNYRYEDGSEARGVAGTDAATIDIAGKSARTGKSAKLDGVVLGCTKIATGSSFLASDGVLSLGFSNVSFAARAAARFGGRFSYCLVDHLSPRNATSFLTFGFNAALAVAASVSSTPLVLNPRLHPFYAVTVTGISVDGELLDIPSSTWDIEYGGGAIVDSGTSLTVLATPAYAAVAAALTKRLEGIPRLKLDPFEYCYNWTTVPSGRAAPKLAVYFAGGASLEPPAKSYVIDAAPGVKCIGMQGGGWPAQSVIGNILQQDHLWEFDLKNRRLRFKASSC